MNVFFSENKAIILYLALFIIILIFAVVLLLISKNFEKSISPVWIKTSLYEYKEFQFFLEKASAYRRVFFYFTFLSYFVKTLGVLTTFYIVYAMIDNGIFSKFILILSAMFDSISLLFPFQKYIDLFSKCCVDLEETIFQSDAKLHEGKIGESPSADQPLSQLTGSASADGDNGNSGEVSGGEDPTQKNNDVETNSIFIAVYQDLQKKYIECERLLHVENKI